MPMCLPLPAVRPAVAPDTKRWPAQFDPQQRSSNDRVTRGEDAPDAREIRVGAEDRCRAAQ